MLHTIATTVQCYITVLCSNECVFVQYVPMSVLNLKPKAMTIRSCCYTLLPIRNLQIDPEVNIL